MVKYKKRTFLCVILCLTLLTGCGKKEEIPYLAVPETTQETATLPMDTAVTTEGAQPQKAGASAPEGTTTFDYAPNEWAGTYITADPNIAAGPDVLDNIAMTLPEGVTRHRVSDRQFDFVKNGAQVGGFMLVDISRDMLEKAAKTMNDFGAAADHLGKQVMSDIYPSEAYISGGGKIEDTNFYMAVMIETEKRGDIWTQYLHRIYVGEQYCYDFWIDEAFWGDSGFGITDSLSGGDIKPELNQAEFAWSFADMPKTRRPFG